MKQQGMNSLQKNSAQCCDFTFVSGYINTFGPL